MIVEDHRKQQNDGLARLKEAREFAEWSHKDRESKVPQLTAEQRKQLNNYLRLVERHGASKAFEDPSLKSGECVGCPIFGAKKARTAVAVSPAS